MVDVFEQVEEELRSDRYKRLARTWLPVVGGILLLALIAALAWWGWTSYQDNKADKASQAYDRGMEALQANNTAGANAAFTEAANEGNGAYKALALQQQAGLAVTANKIPEAVALFDQAAKASGDPILADPASLKAAWLLMDTASFDEIAKRLTPLTAEGRPLRAFAQEALALANLQAGKSAEARTLCSQLTVSLDAPDAVRQIAQQCIDAVDTGAVASLPGIIAAQKTLPPQPVLPVAAPGSAPSDQAPAQ